MTHTQTPGSTPFWEAEFLSVWYIYRQHGLIKSNKHLRGSLMSGETEETKFKYRKISTEIRLKTKIAHISHIYKSDVVYYCETSPARDKVNYNVEEGRHRNHGMVLKPCTTVNRILRQPTQPSSRMSLQPLISLWGPLNLTCLIRLESSKICSRWGSNSQPSALLTSVLSYKYRALTDCATELH